MKPIYEPKGKAKEYGDLAVVTVLFIYATIIYLGGSSDEQN